MVKLDVGSRVKILPEYKEYNWYSEDIYYITSISDSNVNDGTKIGVATLNKNLDGVDGTIYSNKIKLSLLYDIVEDRKEKLLKIKNKI
jgi:hypothetical protein